MSVGVAILGGGIFAREEHKPAIEAAKDLTLRAVYSRSLKSAKTLEADERTVNLYSDDSGPGRSLEDLLARSDIHAVVIALPIPRQPEFIRKALLAGKHVMSEKPIAPTVKDAKDLIRWYKSEIDSAKVFWCVAENYRFLKTFEEAADTRQTQGRALTFRLRKQALVQAGGKYFETEYARI